MNERIKERGFTLIELLVVVLVIAIIVAIATPRLTRATRAANQASAIESMRVISSSEMTYHHSEGRNTFATLGLLADLKMIDQQLGGGGGPATVTGRKSGYEFQITMIAPDAEGLPHYVLSAKPLSTAPVLQTGYVRYGSDDTYQLFSDVNNLDTHYTASTELHSGTSGPLEQP